MTNFFVTTPLYQHIDTKKSTYQLHNTFVLTLYHLQINDTIPQNRQHDIILMTS